MILRLAGRIGAIEVGRVVVRWWRVAASRCAQNQFSEVSMLVCEDLGPCARLLPPHFTRRRVP